MKQVPVVNREKLLDEVTKLVEANQIILMPDPKHGFAGVDTDSGIGVKLTRTDKGNYKVQVSSPEGHTWIACDAGSGLWKKWSALYDLAASQQEDWLAPRLTKLVEQAAKTVKNKRDVRA